MKAVLFPEPRPALPPVSCPPGWRIGAIAGMPCPDWLIRQMAGNHLVSGSLPACMTVPAISDPRCRRPGHWYTVDGSGC